MATDVDHNYLQYEYRRALDAIASRSGFSGGARDLYPELLQPGSLRDVPRLSSDDCDLREINFLMAWRTHLENNLAKFVGHQLD